MTELDPLRPSPRLLWSGLISDDPAAEVGVLGVPFDGGARYRRGTAFAPSRLRELTTYLMCCADEGQPLSLRVRDYGDIFPDLEWSRYFQAVEERAIGVFHHSLALFLGGDHSVTIPLVRAFDRTVEGPFGLLCFDAHPDLFDVYDGHRWSHGCPARRALELPGLDDQHLVFVGLRSIARDEWDFLQAHPEISYYTARQCYLHGMEAIAEKVIAKLQDVHAVYVTLDIDSLDPAYAPGTTYSEAGGLSTRELLELVRVVFQELSVRAMDIVEVVPPLDHGDITSFAALKIIYEAWWATQKKMKSADTWGTEIPKR